ncbi:MAG: cyclic nucleotide-binding domain-containing protein [Verrucomicrobiota bacterium]
MNPILSYCEQNDIPMCSYEPSETVIKEGAEEDVLLVMKSGNVSIQREGVELSSIDYEGALFGEVSILVGGAHTATVVAIDESSFYAIKDGPAFLEENPDLGLHVAYVLASRLKAITANMAKLDHELGDQEEELDLMTDLVGGLMRMQERGKSEVQSGGEDGNKTGTE